jgi:hypothetical protein
VALRSVGASATLVSLLLAGCSSTAPPPRQAQTGQPFDSYQVAQDGRTVVVAFVGAPDQPGPCGWDYVAQASETSERVYIRVHGVPHDLDGPGQVACPAIGQRRTAEVRLQTPLGDRAVVDGTTDDLLVQPTP